jgi:hypothetical protein
MNGQEKRKNTTEFFVCANQHSEFKYAFRKTKLTHTHKIKMDINYQSLHVTNYHPPESLEHWREMS